MQVLLVDDHSILRLGVRTLLQTSPFVSEVYEAGSRQEALNQLDIIQPGLVIADLVLGFEDGLEFLKELRALYPDLRILVLTMQDESIYAERVIRAGAKGFLAKQDATQHLLNAVETICEGEIYLSRPSYIRIAGKKTDELTPEPGTPISALSDRELHVFQMIGAGKATREISSHLNLSPKTIETYRENIKRKLNLANASALREAAETWVLRGNL